jgi:hypothetical protein
MLDDAPRRSGPVRVSWLPGHEPAPVSVDAEAQPLTKLPFIATITANGRTYEVEVLPVGLRFSRWLD